VNDIAYSAAIGLAVVFSWAGVAKLARPRRTRRSFRALGVPAPLARVVPLVEIALAIALVAVPRIGGALAAILLGAFTVVLRRAGEGVNCACFGGTATATPTSIARNVALALAAGVAATSSPVVPGFAAATVATGVALLAAVILAVADLGRRTGAVLRVDLP